MSNSKAKAEKLDFDPYEVLGVARQTWNEDEIKGRFRKAALKWHPDKNPHRVKEAQAMFVKISRAFEILTDPAVKAAYDNLKKAQEATKERLSKYDAKRRKLREELEEREAGCEYQRQKETVDAQTKLQAEIERLRREGSKLLQSEREKVEREVHMSCPDFAPSTSPPPRLRLRWKAEKSDRTNGGYSPDILQSIFTKYGDVTTVVLSSKRNGSAIVEMSTVDSAEKAVALERGLPENPFSQVDWMSAKSTNGNLPPHFTRDKPKQSQETTRTEVEENFADFEANVLAAMKSRVSNLDSA